MADSLIAFRDGDQGEMGRTGSMLLAEALWNLRNCSDFVVAWSRRKA
jgi:hypothetical protein